jgi:hypothetical protein|tara:strand:- start:34339 stop:34908 length:570 start_codon:yes stop_codon:yes gene_type:complete
VNKNTLTELQLLATFLAFTIIFVLVGIQHNEIGELLTAGHLGLRIVQGICILGIGSTALAMALHLRSSYDWSDEEEPEVEERDYPFETASFQNLRNLLILDGLPPEEIDHFRDCLYALEQHGYDIVDYGRKPVAPFTTDANRAFHTRKIRESLDRMRAKGNVPQGRQPHSSPEQLKDHQHDQTDPIRAQ